MIKDLTILIQGRCEEEQIKLWIENYSEWNVIISTWVDYNLDLKLPENWKLIKSEYPNRLFDMQNIDLQITSTLNGLKQVQTDYVLKVRGDEFYSKIELIYNRMKTIHPKVLVSSIFFRPLGLYLYHISDHFICTTKENLNLMFQSTYDYLINYGKFNNSPESHFGFCFIRAKENWNSYDVVDYIDINDDMTRKWYSIFDVNELKPYIVSQSGESGRIYYRDNYGYNGHNINEL